VIDINVRGVFIRDAGGAEAHEDGGRIISIGSAVGERVAAPGLVPYRARRSREDVHSGAGSRDREPGHHGQQRPAGPIDTDLNPAAGDWAVPQKAATGLDRYGRVDEIAPRGVHRRSGVLVHYRFESHR